MALKLHEKKRRRKKNNTITINKTPNRYKKY